MKQSIAAATLHFTLALAAVAAGAQTYPDLGHALYARGYSGSVWVNSFDPSQPYLAHGVFYPDTPFAASGSYETRYGMEVTGSGTVSVDANGLFAAAGTAHNPNAITSDGSILIELLSDGNLADSTKVLFVCPALSDCPWTGHFTTRSDPSHTWSVRVRRHVEGARSGGERNIDLNGPCHAALVGFFQLPASYVFTTTDLIDTNYASKPGDQDSVLGTLLAPVLCAGGNTQSPPVSAFTFNPTEVYPGLLVSFTDTSANLPTTWAWSFQGGSPSASSGPAPQVSFSSIGPKTVTLQAGNAAGLGNVFTKTITVLDPNPQGTVAASLASVTQCQSVDFTASATGAPPLIYTWEVLDPSNTTLNPPGRVPGSSAFTWSSLPGNQPGTYTAKVTVSNGANPNGVALTRQVQLVALPALTDISGAAPTTNNFLSNAVQFTAPAYAGATQVVWDYGDGKTDTFTDPVAGRTPSHTYGATGTYNAKVTISNCVSPAGSTSQAVSVNVKQATALVASFRANDVTCQFGQCTFAVGQAASFVDSSSGATLWDYDWTHTSASAQTCNFTDADHTAPATSHTFASAGTFYPCLRVRRGTGEQDVTVHPAISVTGSNNQPPSIAVAGPASGQVNQPYAFNGAASNCTASAGGWTWSVSGGVISGGAGAATGSSISVSWSAAGAKTVSATNGGCAGAQGNWTITVSAVGPPQAQFTFSPSAPKASEVVSFDASSSSNVASGSTYGWDFGDGSTGTGPVVLHGFADAGSFNVRLTLTPPGCLNTGCLSQAAKTVVVAPNGGPRFTVSPASPGAGETVTFDATSSTNVAAGSNFGWSFGDGSGPSFGTVVSHVFGHPGSYNVLLAVAPPGCASASCLVLAPKTLAIGPPPPVLAEFTANVSCQGASDGQCQAQTGKSAALTATATDAGTYSWSFGDGTTGTGRQAYHAWAAPGSYPVTLTVTKGTASASKTRTFTVTGPPPPKYKTVLLPWVFESRGPLVQSNDLYVYNPDAAPLDVTVELRRRGTVEDNPPRVPVTLAPGATLFVPDVLLNLFDQQDVAGFITVTASSETVAPVVTSFDSSGQTASKLFGAAVAGSPFSPGDLIAPRSTPAAPQYLVGLSDNTDRQTSFGLTNPSDQPATFRLRVVDHGGNLLGESDAQSLDRFGQRQFEVQEIRDLFGVTSLQDYRVEVESVSGPPVFPFGSDVRLSTGDPSFTQPGSYTAPTVYLLGVLNGAGTGTSALQTDLLLSNVGDQAVQTSVQLTKLSAKAAAPQVAQVALQPGATARLANVLLGQFGLRSGVGVLTVSSTSPNGVYPIVKAESFDNANPQQRFGQSLVALTDDDAADSTQKLVLVGLRQDNLNKTTLWLFNPSGDGGEYDLVYRDLTGNVLGTVRGAKVAAGQMRQFLPTQHPIKKGGAPNGFTVEVVVKSGKALAAAQVVRGGSNDPAYIPGVVR